MDGCLARINFGCEKPVTLRVSIFHSCSQMPSCKGCEDPSFTDAQKDGCYAAGCSCYAHTCKNLDRAVCTAHTVHLPLGALPTPRAMGGTGARALPR